MSSGVFDPGVERLKNARDNVAVLKLQLIQIRSRCPASPIFAVEGIDDKSVYSNWTRRVKDGLSIEYYVCSGKKQVLMLLDAVKRDVNNLADSVYFFIDRDFDDLAGSDPHPNLFMTDMYSVENYLITEPYSLTFYKSNYIVMGFQQSEIQFAIFSRKSIVNF